MTRKFPESFVFLLALFASCWFAGASGAAGLAQNTAAEAETSRILAQARAGDPVAQRLLGARYERGNGVRRSYENAARWYRSAALKGDVIAQRNMGYMYESGVLGEKDYAEAEKWYRQAAERGDTESQRSLAYLYGSGMLGSVDQIEAAKWRDRAEGRSVTDPAAEISSAKATAPDPAERASQRAAGRIGQGGSVTLSTAMGTVGPSRSPLNRVASIAAPNPKATGKPLDIGLALNRYVMDAEDGNLYAQYRLGLIYLNGIGVEPNNVKAFDLISTAAKGGNARAQAAMGALYVKGLGVPRDPVRAYAWFSLAERGLAEGTFLNRVATYRLNAEAAMTDRERAAAQRLTAEWEKDIRPPATR